MSLLQFRQSIVYTNYNTFCLFISEYMKNTAVQYARFNQMLMPVFSFTLNLLFELLTWVLFIISQKVCRPTVPQASIKAPISLQHEIDTAITNQKRPFLYLNSSQRVSEKQGSRGNGQQQQQSFQSSRRVSTHYKFI